MYLKSKIQRIKIHVLWTIYVKQNPHNNTWEYSIYNIQKITNALTVRQNTE